MNLTPHEMAFLSAYRASPANFQAAVRKILDIPEEEQEERAGVRPFSSQKRARTRATSLSFPTSTPARVCDELEISDFDRHRIQEEARKCLRDFDVDPSHVDLHKIIKGANIHVVRNTMVHDLNPGEYGRCMTADGKTWHVVYDDTLPAAERRFTVAHELGHIFLQHNKIYYQLARLREKEANLFAEQLLKDHQS